MARSKKAAVAVAPVQAEPSMEMLVAAVAAKVLAELSAGIKAPVAAPVQAPVATPAVTPAQPVGAAPKPFEQKPLKAAPKGWITLAECQISPAWGECLGLKYLKKNGRWQDGCQILEWRNGSPVFGWPENPEVNHHRVELRGVELNRICIEKSRLGL
jgi:hypothetical protein